MLKREIITAVRELLERHYDKFEIAHRLGLDPADVQMFIEIIKQTLI